MTDLLDAATSPSTKTGHTWRFGDAFLLRVAGQPVDVTAELRTPDTRRWTETVFAREAAKEAAGAALRDVLEQLIADTASDDPARIALINLRRDVFNARRPRPSTVTKAEVVLSAESRELLATWLSTEAALRDTLAAGQDIVAAEMDRVRARAREVVADDELRKAVLLQSEVLERNMDRYLSGARKLDKSGRRMERTLLELLYRAAHKTSPFSTLTSVALGRFSDRTTRVRPAPASLEQQSSARLNVAVLARLAAVILADPDLRASIRVTLAPGANTMGATMRYVRRRTSSNADPDAVVAIDSVHEDLFFLPTGPALEDVARLTRDDQPRLRVLAEQVRTAAAERTSAEVEKLLGHLLRLGFLLVPDMQVDLRSGDPVGTFESALRDQDHPTLLAVADLLAQVRGLVDRYPETPARQRRSVVADVRRLVTQIFDTLGASTDLVPRTLIYEDTVTPSEGVEVSRRTWEATVLPGLADLASVLPAFDLNLPRRLTATGFFVARYGQGGTCDDVVRFCHEFQRDFFSPYMRRSMQRRQFDDENAFVRQENWFKLSDISALDDAREHASMMLRDLQAAAGDHAEELQLGAEFVEEVRRRLPPDGRVAHPWSFFTQLASDGLGPRPGRLVLNQAYAGLTLMFSRFAHSLDGAGADATALIRDVLRQYAPSGAVLAELRGGYETTNLNVHPVVTDYEIVCPGDASTRADHEQIRLEDLRLVHEAETDRLALMSDRLGCEVIPVYLGFLMPMALPEIQQVLMCLSPSGMAQVDLWAGTGRPVPPEGITMYPRLLLGDLVLQRRMWKLGTDSFPFRDSQSTDAEHFLRIQRWRRDHGLPERLFARVDAGAPTPEVDGAEGADDGDPGQGDKPKAGRKPLAVDFSSMMSLQLLEQLALGASSRIVLTEAYPDVDDLWLCDGEGRRYVTELLLELYPTSD